MNSSNKTVRDQPPPSALYFFTLSTQLNTIFVLIIVIFGILGNSATIFFLTVKIQNKNKPSSCKLLRLHKSFSSFQSYMLALAASDLIFLFGQLFEDTLPSLATTYASFRLFQLANSSSVTCKLILYLRNATRISSSYLIVLFALER